MKTQGGRRRWWWCASALLILMVFHAPLLRMLGHSLTVDEPIGHSDAVLILSGEHRMQAVADLFAAGKVERVWMILGRPGYLETAGILPLSEEVTAAELTAAGVPADRLDVFRNDEVVGLADTARVVRTLLENASEPTKVLVVCGALDARRIRMVMDDVLGPLLASRISIIGLPYDQFEIDQWWRSRTGLKQVFSQVCLVGFSLAMGTDRRKAPEMVDPDSIEARLQSRFGEAACYAY